MKSLHPLAAGLLKLASDSSDYKKVRVGEKQFLLRKGIPLIGKLPKDPEKAVGKIEQVVQSEQAQQSLILGYKNVAVRAKDMPNMARAGFKPTRIATPLPGEKMLQKSWRKGNLHAHKQGPFYLVHEDIHSPLHPKWGYFHKKGIKHAWKEGLPSIIERYKETHRPLVKKAKKEDKEHKWDQDRGVIYDPGVVAHEAGHVRLHKTVPGMTGARMASNILSKAAPAAYLASGILQNKPRSVGPVAGISLLSAAPTLVDEAYASVKGYKALKESGKYSKEELRDMRNKLIAAGGTYAMTPASFIGAQMFLDVARKTGSRLAYLGSAATPFAADALSAVLRKQLTKDKGPAISAIEARELARKISPNTDVYATDTPIPQGAFAVPKVHKIQRKELEKSLKPVLREKDDRKRLARRGGIVIAPVRDVPRGKLIE